MSVSQTRIDALVAIATAWNPEWDWETCIMCGEPATVHGLILLADSIVKVGWCDGKPECTHDLEQSHPLIVERIEPEPAETVEGTWPACDCPYRCDPCRDLPTTIEILGRAREMADLIGQPVTLETPTGRFTVDPTKRPRWWRRAADALDTFGGDAA